VASEIINTGWRVRLGHVHLPRISPEEAGRNLGRIAGEADLTVFAHYATDHAGHGGTMSGAVRALERVDRFLGGILETLPAHAILVAGSDHGNIEELTGRHTSNPAFGLVAGDVIPEHLDSPQAITDIHPLVLRLLQVEISRNQRPLPR
jgi:bisphosphoglycerate-independent phosphoglycerate mutase (AlkP superfamily)